MSITRLDHANILTADLAGMIRFYVDVLGLENGWRPPFDNVGAWLYAGGMPVVHLVEVEVTPKHEGRIEHFALAGEDMAGFLADLTTHGVEYVLGHVPGTEITQVNIFDPDGNHIHVDFEGEG